MHSIRPLDLAWLLVESENTPMHVGAIQIFSPPQGVSLRDFIDQTRAAWMATPQVQPPFSYRADTRGLKRPTWAEIDHIEIENHLQSWGLPDPAGPAELMALVSRLLGEELDMQAPLWEMHLIEGLSPDRYALFTKIHHAVMDGVGGVNLLHKMLSTDPDTRGLPPPWNTPRRATAGLTTDEASAALGIPAVLRALRHQLGLLPQLGKVFGQLLNAARHREAHPLVAPYRAPECVLNQRISAQRRVVTVDFPLAPIQHIAQQTGTTVNDVFLSICGGALRQYLLEQDALPDTSLTAGLPVSVRPRDDTSVGTAVSFILATLGTNLHEPLHRLHEIHRSTSHAKLTLQGMSRDAITEYTLILMAPYMLELISGLAGHAPAVFNIVISNIPGPRAPLYYNGARLEAMYPMSIVTHGQAINITVLSYDGSMNVGITACENALPQVESLAGHMRDEFATLQALSDMPGAAD